MNNKTKRVLLNVTILTGGLLGFILFRWTPTTGKGILTYAVLFAVLVVMALILSSGKDRGY